MLKLLKFLRKYWWMILISTILIFINVLADLYLPTLMSNIINEGVITGDKAYIYDIGKRMIYVALFGMICSILFSFISAIVSSRFSRDLRHAVFSKVMTFSSNEIDKISTSSLITRSTSDINQVQGFVGMALRLLFIAPLTCIGGIIMALQKNVSLSIIFLIAVPILILAVVLIAKNVIPCFEKFQKLIDNFNLIVRERLSGIRVIRAFNRESNEHRRYMNNNRDLMNLGIKINNHFALLFPLIHLILSLVTIAVVWFGSYQISYGNMLVGDLMAFIQYATQIMFSFVMLTMMFVMMPRAIVSAKRINEVLTLDVKIKDDLRVRSITDDSKTILAFNNVSFAYPNSDEDIVKDLNFTINEGEVVAIVGGTGSGKSTITNLILRLYDAVSGEVLIDGKNIKQLAVHDVRDVISYAPQKALLFTGTVKSNLLFGKEDASEEELIEALKMSCAYDFVMEMDKGINSYISQAGTNLSGGQKQRLSIARAIIKKARLYIFDDSFSALDYKTDSVVRKNLIQNKGDSALLIIATRISTIMNADKIIVMDNGQIVGMDTHSNLYRDNRIYREIVDSQLKKSEVNINE